VLAAALAAVVLMMAVVLLLLRDDPAANRADPPRAGSTTNTTNTTNPTTQPAAPTAKPATTAPPTPAGFVLPTGWRMRDDGTGFQVPVPDGWELTRDDGGRARWSEPNGNRFLLIDQTRKPRPDPRKDWLSNEAARKGGYNDYRRIQIKTVRYWDSAADWEFTYTSNGGTRLHVLNRGFVTAEDQAYSIYWSTPDSQWQSSRDELAVILRGFKPARR
jgi:hypothetical protein